MLQAERKKASFDQDQLSLFIYENRDKLNDFLKVQSMVSNDDILKFDPSNIQTSRSNNMLVHAKKLLRYHELVPFSLNMKIRESLLFSEQMPLSLHFVMFLYTLENLCSDKQVQMFYKPALRGQILGCYAQTELGHGSDVQNLMTTATFDKATDQFIINTPSVKAVKWWIGDLGVYANHAIVFARLILNKQDYGVHAFLVPIRDKNHELYPGVEAGDIGPKYGYNNKDNGFAKFTNYRISRLHMLRKYAKVNKDGEYERRGDQKISYATMLMTRAAIPTSIAFTMSKAITISTRYSLVRRQFKDAKGEEIPILNYQLQQDKIIPRIAETFACLLGSRKISYLALEVFADAKERGIFTRLNEAHALSSLAKAIYTNEAMRGLQIMRRAAGGHGFLMYSGLPGLVQQTAPTVTFQGENTVLFLQVARFLLKSLKGLQKGKTMPESAMYLTSLGSGEKFTADVNATELRNPELVIKIFESWSCYRIQRAAEKLAEGTSQGLHPKEAWNEHAGIELVEAALAFGHQWTLKSFLEGIQKYTNDAKVREVLVRLMLLYGMDRIIEKASSFYEAQVITSETMRQCDTLKEELLAEIRPDALGIVQAFQYDDNTLHSAIGCADGKAYERLLDWSMNKNVVNKEENRQEIITELRKAKSQLEPLKMPKPKL